MIESGVVWLGAGTIVLLLAISAFFSSSEIAIFSIRTEWIDVKVADGDRRASVLRELRDDPHRLLVTILVGNNVVNIAISSITTAILVDVLPSGQAVTVATLLASFVVLVFGEIIPKSFGLGNAEEWALDVARPITIIERLLHPLVTLFDVITRRVSEIIGGEQHIERPYTDDEPSP